MSFHKTLNCEACGRPLELLGKSTKWACGNPRCRRYAKKVLAVNPGNRNFGAALAGAPKLSAREKTWSKSRPRGLPPGVVRCTYQGCRALVTRKNRAQLARCQDHLRTTNGHGRLTAEDRRLLSLLKD